MTKKPERQSRMTPEALDAIAKGSLPKGYRGLFSLETGKPITLLKPTT